MTPAPSLSHDEATRLADCERRIASGLESFKDVGLALAQVRDAKLYRADHATFEDYCRERWGWSARRGYQLMDAAEAIASLPAECEQLFTNEGQARELAKVAPQQREQVVKAAASDGKLTAKAIRAAAQANEPEKPAVAPPDDPETRAFRLSLKAKAMADEFKAYLAAINPTRADLIQAACAFRKTANELDHAAAALPEDNQ